MSQPTIFGWFDAAHQTEPTHQALFDAPCLYCGVPITTDDVRTHSLLREGDHRSYFYRSHRTCATRFASLVESIDCLVFDMIDRWAALGAPGDK